MEHNPTPRTRAPVWATLGSWFSLAVACAPRPATVSRAPLDPIASSVPAAMSADLPIAEAASAARPGPAPAPGAPFAPVTPVGSFERAIAPFEARCQVKPADETHLAAKEAAVRTNACLNRAMVVELDRVLVPLRTDEPRRFAALMAEQATFNRFVDDACWVDEEATWVDPDKGTRDDGSMRNDMWLGCIHAATVERIYYALALRAGDSTTFALHATLVGSSGKGQAALTTFAAQVARLRAPAYAPETHPATIDAAGRDEIAARSRATLAAAGALAAGACDGFAGLRDALAGSTSCHAAMRAYYLAVFRPGFGPE